MKAGQRVRSVDDPKLVGVVVEVLPSGSALVQWDRYQNDRRYVRVADLVIVPA